MNWVVLIAAVLSFYTVSISLTLYNKWTLNSYGFQYPVFLVMFTSSFQWICSVLLRKLALRGTVDIKLRYISDNDYLTTVVPIGVCGALDTSLSIMALSYLSISFHTLIRSTIPGFVLFFSVAFGVQKLDWFVSFIIFLMTSGLVIGSLHQIDKASVFGFLCCTVSVLACGLRWSLTQKLLQQSDGGVFGPINYMYYINPISLMTLFPMMIYYEALPLMAFFEQQDDAFGSFLHVVQICVSLSLLVYALIYAELVIIEQASSIAMSVLGVTKELLLVGVSVFVRGETLSPMNAFGFGMCVVAIILYKYHSYQNLAAVTGTAENRSRTGSCGVIEDGLAKRG